MEKQNNHQYGQTDPDFIEQNILVDGNNILNEDQLHQTVQKEHTPEFGESDPDYIEQNAPVDNDNYARDEDPYEYEQQFIEDLKHPENDQSNKKIKSEKIDQEQIINKNDAITNDDRKSDLNKDSE
jgi:hypothetical protein